MALEVEAGWVEVRTEKPRPKTIKKFEVRHKRVRVEEPGAPHGRKADSPWTIADIGCSILNGEEQEVFLVFLLDINNRINGFVEVARGSIDSCMIDPRAVFRVAIMEGASSIIVMHNHPSDSVDPSEQDRKLTDRLVECGKLLGVSVLDHIIMGDASWTSMAERGLIKGEQTCGNSD